MAKDIFKPATPEEIVVRSLPFICKKLTGIEKELKKINEKLGNIKKKL